MYSCIEIGDELSVDAAQRPCSEELRLLDSRNNQVIIEPVPHHTATLPSPLPLVDSLAQYCPLTPPISPNPSRMGIIAPSSTMYISISPQVCVQSSVQRE